MRIALCDDEVEQVERIEGLLKEYAQAHPCLELSVSSFFSACALLDQSQAQAPFDIYLLDIIMPGMDGIDLGLQLRQTDRLGTIIYLTSSREYAVESYQVRAAGYLLKPVGKEQLFQALDRETERFLSRQRDFFVVKTGDGLWRVALHDIVYAELVGRRIVYHLTDGSVLEGMTVRGSFRTEMEPLLKEERFALCSASFVVNLAAVVKVKGGALRLSDGRTIPLSRTMKREVTERWLSYSLKQGS